VSGEEGKMRFSDREVAVETNDDVSETKKTAGFAGGEWVGRKFSASATHSKVDPKERTTQSYTKITDAESFK
jgi:hypothetical protein